MNVLRCGKTDFVSSGFVADTVIAERHEASYFPWTCFLKQPLFRLLTKSLRSFSFEGDRQTHSSVEEVSTI